ncbi:MAG: hypothetical protein DSY42_00015 [Aquifex sp.]|nr:MAG: hypothetical protein DSY42_00015 [Aquifex sp.]
MGLSEELIKIYEEEKRRVYTGNRAKRLRKKGKTKKIGEEELISRVKEAEERNFQNFKTQTIREKKEKQRNLKGEVIKTLELLSNILEDF